MPLIAASPHAAEGKPQAEADEVKALVAAASTHAFRIASRHGGWRSSANWERAGSGPVAHRKGVAEAAGRANASQPKAPQTLVMDTYAIMAGAHGRRRAGERVISTAERPSNDPPEAGGRADNARLPIRGVRPPQTCKGEASARWHGRPNPRRGTRRQIDTLRDTETRNCAEMPDKSFVTDNPPRTRTLGAVLVRLIADARGDGDKLTSSGEHVLRPAAAFGQ